MNKTLLRTFSLEIAGSLLLAVPSAVLGESRLDSNWFVEAGLTSVDASGTVSGFTVDGEETGWLFGVGYAFNKNFALQANYHDLGKGHFATDCPPPNLCLVENLDRVDIDGYSFSAIGSWPITSRIDVYGKVGIMSWDADFQLFAQDASGEDFLYGVGLGLDLSPNWRLSLQYDAFGFEVDSAGIGLTRRFGGR